MITLLLVKLSRVTLLTRPLIQHDYLRETKPAVRRRKTKKKEKKGTRKERGMKGGTEAAGKINSFIPEKSLSMEATVLGTFQAGDDAEATVKTNGGN